MNITAWTLEDITQAILTKLPPDLEFRYGVDAQVGTYYVAFLRNEVPVWERWGLEERILRLDAYGWVLERFPATARPAKPSMWGPRAEVTLPAVQRRALDIADPPDLDPAHLTSVYGQAEKKEPK